jgi:acyl-CoA oxidase
VDARTRAVQAPSTAMIVASEVDPRADLARERASATFPARELAALLAGGEDKLVLREKVGDAVRAHPVFSKKGKYFMERADLYRTTLEKYLALPALAAELGARGVGDPMAIGRVIREMIDEPGGLDLHLGMFIPTIQGQADEEQKKYWMPRCVKLQIIGTYAQTELGHGTYIRGLETTATYDPPTEQFVIHSPTLTSTKWWPGGMGKTATHAIVMARLITPRGEDKGPHAFVVQIRSNEDHATMPGVTAGDIGPENGIQRRGQRFPSVRPRARP